MNKLLALDLFCGAGGASMGLYRASFNVIGVDIRPLVGTGIDIEPYCGLISVHEIWTPQRTTCGLVRLRKMRHRAMGFNKAWQTTKPHLQSLPQRQQSKPSTPFWAGSSALAWRTVSNGRRLCRSVVAARSSICVDAQQRWLCLRASIGDGAETRASVAFFRGSTSQTRTEIEQQRQQSCAVKQERSRKRTSSRATGVAR